MAKYIDKLRPLATGAVEAASQASYFTKEEVLSSVVSRDSYRNIEAELAKVKGWDLPLLLRGVVSSLISDYLVNARDRRGIRVFRSYPVPGGPRRYMRFMNMGYSQMQAHIGDSASRLRGAAKAFELDNAIWHLLGDNPQLKVADVIDRALEMVQKKELR